MRRVLWAMLIVGSTVAAAVGGCTAASSPGPSETGERGVVELSERDTSRVVEVSPGESVVVRLESNPSTGYEWGYELSDESILTLSDQSFETESDLAGSPGVEVFTFQAESAGRSTISLAYRRPWETDVEPEETVSYEVVVDG